MFYINAMIVKPLMLKTKLSETITKLNS